MRQLEELDSDPVDNTITKTQSAAPLTTQQNKQIQ